MSVWASRDEDTIGKDEFLGELIVPLSALKEDEKLDAGPHTAHKADLQPRSGKKEKVTGNLSFSYSYLTEATEKKYIAAREEEDRKRTEEAKKKAEAEKAARAEQVDKLLESLPKNEGADLTKLRELADKVVAKAGKRITDKKVLKSLLVDLNLWDLVKRYSLWANDLQKGFDNLPTSATTQREISADSANLDAEMDRAWSTHDTVVSWVRSHR